MPVTIRPIVPAELDEFWTKLWWGFGEDPREETGPSRLQRIEALMGLDRTIAAFDDGEIVGTGGAVGFDMTVPGGAVPMGGVSMLTVQPTHTRRGLLTGMIGAHLDDARTREEVVSGLWASESPIYGRFGYGVAAEYVEIGFDARIVGLQQPTSPDQITLLDAEAATEVVPDVYAAAVRHRPGLLSRSEAWWKYRWFEDPEHERRGRSKQRYAVASREGEAVGYAAYRQKARWDDFLPEGTVHVTEVVGLDEEARRSLWAYLTAIDLFPNVEHWNVPPDFELPLQVRDPRRIKRSVHDGLYLRLVDTARALAARRYRVDGSLVIGVVEGGEVSAFRLEAEDGEAACARTDAEPDVTMDIGTLSSLYLGGSNAMLLARVGRITGAADAVRRLDLMMSWDVAPWCADVF